MKTRGVKNAMLFVVLLFLMIAVAWLVPGPGVATGPFSLRELTGYGVSLIFLFYGIGLSPRRFREGLLNVRLHLLVHATTFLLFPLLALAGLALFAHEGNRLLRLGVFYLAILPSTVSSSVVFVALARGNVPGAIFNAGVSGLLGVFLTPLWMSVFPLLVGPSGDGAGVPVSSPGFSGNGAGDAAFDPLGAVVSLIILVVLPVVLGLLLHGRLGEWVGRHGRRLRLFDQAVVLAIVYGSFSDSFARGSFDGFSRSDIALLAAGMVAFFLVVFGISWLACRLLRFSEEDTITATFCGSKKSLMHGTVMAGVLLTGIDGTGVVLLPLMLYHALQLLLVGVIAARMRRGPIRGPDPAGHFRR